MIYKYVLGIPYQTRLGRNTLLVKNAEIKKVLDIQLQGEVAVMWAEVELQDYNTQYVFDVVWTGYPAPKDMEYVSTIQEPDTGLVYHYYVYNRPIHFNTTDFDL